MPDQSAGSPGHTLIVGLGNPLRGDDGVGIAILDWLAESGKLPVGVELADGGSAGVGLIPLMQGYRCVIVVDAARMDCLPGEWRRFPLDGAWLASRHEPLTAHDLGLAEALRLAVTLDLLPPRIALYGVQPEKVGWQPGLSEPVRAAVPPICRAILREVSKERN